MREERVLGVGVQGERRRHGQPEVLGERVHESGNPGADLFPHDLGAVEIADTARFAQCGADEPIDTWGLHSATTAQCLELIHESA
ncbi:hypothetical protein [Umezawaea sp. Da 62-37]|uniref:hypothetical protein n=1 Tax=Umezawaea sp. Da 62-37 TaxID=3075927 RepID=UPI0028F745DE|nr:hypothetical protein [Umezawaea sp. Da 62-37]WNV90397.1 hypothetical protein RM788_19575 [Umezawaea sp. Da 62-37]